MRFHFLSIFNKVNHFTGFFDNTFVEDSDDEHSLELILLYFDSLELTPLDFNLPCYNF